MMNQKKIGLALSGGGYRAAAFHLGTLRKLNELRILNKINTLSTISGGSITGALYCTFNHSFDEFEKSLKLDLSTKDVVNEVLLSSTFLKTLLFVLIFLTISFIVLFSSYPWLSPLVLFLLIFLLLRFQFIILPVSKEIEKVYNKFFYQNLCLKDLNEKPELAIGSTNLQTGRPFTFSRRKMSDSTYDHPSDGKGAIAFRHENFPIARAVTASTCVPFAFTPIKIDKPFFQNYCDYYRINPQLVDGGIYDNQGIHKITQKGSSYECDTIITSDAGNKLPFEQSYNNTIILLIRTVDVFMSRIKRFQMVQNIYENTEFSNKQIAYLSLGWDLDNCIPGFIANLKNRKITQEVVQAHKIPREWENDPETYQSDLTELLEANTGYKDIFARNLSSEELEVARNVGTNLTKLSEKKIDCLIRHSENLTELQVKLYCPKLIQYV